MPNVHVELCDSPDTDIQGKVIKSETLTSGKGSVECVEDGYFVLKNLDSAACYYAIGLDPSVAVTEETANSTARGVLLAGERLAVGGMGEGKALPVGSVVAVGAIT